MKVSGISTSILRASRLLLQAASLSVRKPLDKFDANLLAECSDEALEALRAEMAEVAHQLHYLLHGEREGRRPRSSFNPNTYSDSHTRKQLPKNKRNVFAHAIRHNNVRPLTESSQLRIKIVVSEDSLNPPKGDIAKAHALATAFKEHHGHSISVDVRGPRDRYNTVGYDVVIAMLHDIDPVLVNCPYTLKAGWIINWPHAWLNHSNSSHWDFFFVASEAGLHLVKQECDVPGYLLCQSVDTSSMTRADSERTVDGS